MKSIRVVISAGLEVGGLELSIVHLLPELNNLGWEMTAVVTASATCDDPTEGATYSYFRRHMPTVAAKSFSELREAFRSADLVHVHASTLLRWSRSALAAAALCRCPLVLTTHAPAFPLTPERRIGLLRQRLRELRAAALVTLCADAVLAPSTEAAAIARHRFRPFPIRVSRILNGVPDRGVGKSPGAQTFLTAALIGRLSEHKMPSEFVKLIDLVRSRGVDIRGEIVGGGPLEEEIRAQILRLELEEVVQMAGWVADPTDFIQRSDVLVLPSISEANPLVAMEAAASGRCTVARSTVGGVGEVLPRSAVFVHGPSFAEVAADFLSSPDARPKLATAGATARDEFERSFSTAAASAAFNEMYVRLIQGDVSGTAAFPRFRSLFTRHRHAKARRA